MLGYIKGFTPDTLGGYISGTGLAGVFGWSITLILTITGFSDYIV